MAMTEAKAGLSALRQAIAEQRVPKTIGSVFNLFEPVLRQARAAKLQNLSEITISFTHHHVADATAVVHGSIQHQGGKIGLASVHSEGKLTGPMRRRRWTSSKGTRDLLWDSPHLIKEFVERLERSMPGKIAELVLTWQSAGSDAQCAARIALFPTDTPVSSGHLAGYLTYQAKNAEDELHLSPHWPDHSF